MRSTAIRALCFVVLALGGVSSGAAMAGAQLDPIRTVTSAISTVASTTVASDLTGSVTSATSGASGATGAVSGATDAVSGSATDSNRGSPQTRFDRLPRRYESLLERIESGRHVRANIARLRAMLVSASPQLRARVMRFIRLEIRRLERGGLTRGERAAVQRLRTLLTGLQGQAPRPATQGRSSLGRVEGSGIPLATVSGRGVAAATAGSESGLAGSRPTSGRGQASSAPRLGLPLLPPSSDLPYWPLLLLVLAAIACFVLVLSGPPQHLLPSPVRGMVGVRRPDVLALAVAIGLGLVMGLLTVLVVQTVLL